MKLKTLTLYGFKSFPEKTTFEFEPGITGIVGPNGCGKSNVVDAVRWTLGEQSAKKLRGQEMADIIFNGSSSRKSLGYAEVSMTFNNESGVLPVDYAEVCITRRLYKTGESEYMINKQPCRLKDIKELFMDTGVGVDAYSSIEQGKVDLLLNANSKERRVVFEEAAGISRYKAKRKECLAKLERTEANLLRAEDVIRELETRIRSLRRQAGKARRYKEFQSEMRELQVKFSEHKFSKLTMELEQERAKIEEVSKVLRELTSSRDEIEQKIAEKENRRLGLDDRLADVQGKVANLQGTIEASQERIQSQQARVEELGVVGEKLVHEESSVSERIEEIGKRITEAGQRLEESRSLLEKLGEEIQSKEVSLEETSRYEERLRFAVGEKRSMVVDLVQERSKRESRLGALTSEKQMLDDQKHRLVTRMAALRNGVKETEERRSSVALQRVEVANRARSVEEELCRLHGRLDSVEKQIDDAKRTNDELERKKASLESRRELLASLDARGEGLSKGVRLLISRDESKYRLLADGVKVDIEHVAAVEAALGERIQAIVTADTATAVEGRKLLNGSGRAIFVSLDLVSNSGSSDGEPEGLKSLAELVQCDGNIRPAVEHLLDGTYLVDSIEDAIAVSRTVRGRFVTSDGCLVDGATIAAGKPGSEEGGIIWRRSQMEEIGREITRVYEEQARHDDTLNDYRAQHEEQKNHLFRFEKMLENASEEIRSFERDIAHQLRERNRLNKEIAGCGEEVSVLDHKVRSAAAEMESLQEEVDALNDERKRTEEDIRRLDEKLSSVTQKRKDEESELSSSRVQAAKTEETIHRLAESRTRFESELAEKENALSDCRAEQEQCTFRRGEAKEEIGRSKELLQRSLQEKEGIDNEVQNIQSARSEICRDIEAANVQRVGLNDKVKAKEADLSELRIREGELSVRMDSLQENVREEYGLELSAEDIEEHVDWDEVDVRIKDLKDKMAKMGNVNLSAIDELAEIEERTTFLTSQRDDLLKAKANLETLIQKINDTSREKFQATFDAVKENFQEMFRKLFGGGKADVFLEEDVEDVLEAGIEVVAKPPGKELRSLSLLSGGEKALTAVALLFAIFKSRPSPFCILDEVDAPLDESNVKRFANVLLEFLEHSQFLLITHNKKSMSVADCLYGVTMEEPGVSKKISVKFQEAAEMVA